MEQKKDKIDFLDSLIKHLMRSGKKGLSHYLVYASIFKLSKKYNKNPQELYDDIFEKIRPFVEIRRVRVRRTTYTVPFPTNEARQKHLASSWLLETVRKDKRKLSFIKKLEEELAKILEDKGLTLEKKKDVYKQVERGKAYMHYRWY